MPYYQCLLRGEKFPGEIIGRAGLYGFYTTRWVQALNEKRAELRAVEALRHDPKLALPPGVSLPTDARVYLDEVEQVSRLPRIRGGGATWFREEESPGKTLPGRQGRKLRAQ